MSVRIFWDVTLHRWISGSRHPLTQCQDQNAQLPCCKNLKIHVCFVNIVYLNSQNSCTVYSVHSDDWNINTAALQPFS